MNRGYTLLELIIATMIFCILLVVISGFVGLGLQFSRNSEKLISRESHYRNTMLFVERNLESKSQIVEIRGKAEDSNRDGDFTDRSSKIELSLLRLNLEENIDEFSLYVGESTGDGKKTIKYEKSFKSSGGKMQCGNNIEKLYVEPVPEGSSFREARGIKFIFQNTVGRRTVEFEKTVYFKNRGEQKHKL